METRKVKKCPFCGEYHDAQSKFCGKTGKNIEFVEIVEIFLGNIGKTQVVESTEESKGGDHVAEEEEFKAEFIPVEGMEPGFAPERRPETQGTPIILKLASPLLLIMGFGMYFVLGEAEIMSEVALKTLCVFLEILAFGIGLALAFSYYRKDEGAVATNIISAALALLIAGFLAFI
jgi:hypothetical protein